MSDCHCPYCNADVEIIHDDGYGYEEDQTHQQRCGACDKMFVYQTHTHFYYETEKADCLNGGEHKYKLTTTYPPEFARMRCEDCGDEKPGTNPEPQSPANAPISNTPPPSNP